MSDTDLTNQYIAVRTTGPIYDRRKLEHRSRNLINLVTDISSEVDDIHGQYKSEIHKSVEEAIRYCERETFYFNQSRDVNFFTVPRQQSYSLRDNVNISSSPCIDRVFILASGSKIELTRKIHSEVEHSIGNTEYSTPSSYSYFDRKLFFYPTPADKYSVQLVLSPVRFDDFSDTHQTNPFLTEAYDMIKYKAKHLFYKNHVKDYAQADLANADFNDQLYWIRYETSKRKNVKKIIPSEF